VRVRERDAPFFDTNYGGLCGIYGTDILRGDMSTSALTNSERAKTASMAPSVGQGSIFESTIQMPKSWHHMPAQNSRPLSTEVLRAKVTGQCDGWKKAIKAGNRPRDGVLVLEPGWSAARSGPAMKMKIIKERE